MLIKRFFNRLTGSAPMLVDASGLLSGISCKQQFLTHKNINPNNSTLSNMCDVHNTMQGLHSITFTNASD